MAATVVSFTHLFGQKRKLVFVVRISSLGFKHMRASHPWLRKIACIIVNSCHLMRWMSSATSASPDEARKEWRRGGMMFLFHVARFRSGRNFLICFFVFFFHVLSSKSNLLDWPKHVFSFLPRKGIEKGMDNTHSDVRVDILSLIVWTQIGSILHSRPQKRDCFA